MNSKLLISSLIAFLFSTIRHLKKFLKGIYDINNWEIHRKQIYIHTKCTIPKFSILKNFASKSLCKLLEEEFQEIKKNYHSREFSTSREVFEKLCYEKLKI